MGFMGSRPNAQARRKMGMTRRTRRWNSAIHVIDDWQQLQTEIKAEKFAAEERLSYATGDKVERSPTGVNIVGT
jgi:hypothetical protein